MKEKRMYKNTFCKIVAGLALCLVGLLPLHVLAADITIEASLSPRQAQVGQHLKLIISIEGKANLRTAPELPPMPEFQVYGGGRSSNFSFINGQVSSTLNFTYVLVPKKAGQYVINPIQLEYKGKVYKTEAIPVTITGTAQGYTPQGSTGSSSGPSQSTRQMPPQAAPPRGSVQNNEAVFITTTVDRKKVYVNEPVILSFRFYSRIPILSQPQFTPPETSGFWAEDLPPQKEYITQIKGQEYRVIEIRSALFPTTSGKLTISPAQLTIQVQDFQRRMRDPFSNMFLRDFFSQGQQVNLHSKPITIQVEPVPTENRPKDFTGTVGKWSMSASLDRTEAKVGEAVTLEIRLFGEGNVKSVGKPKLPPLTGFKVYETVSSSEVQKKENKIQGVKIYRTLLRPEVTGTLSIPNITYNYFNPRSKSFEQVKVPSLHLKVTPGEKQAASVMMSDEVQSTGPGVKVVAKDIRYLKTNIPLNPAAPPLPPWFWIIGFLVPPVGLLLFWRWQQHREKLAADPRYARKLRASQSAHKALKKARTACIKGESKQFYALLEQALIGYLADEIGASRSGITKREIIQKLQQAGAESELTEELTVLFDEADFARFAAGDRDAMEMVAHLKQAEELLTQLSRIINKDKK